MSEQRWERWGAASGFAALVAGGAGGALERGWPSATDPFAVAVFLVDQRGAILASRAGGRSPASPWPGFASAAPALLDIGPFPGAAASGGPPSSACHSR